jgi:hypothetical protein
MDRKARGTTFTDKLIIKDENGDVSSESLDLWLSRDGFLKNEPDDDVGDDLEIKHLKNDASLNISQDDRVVGNMGGISTANHTQVNENPRGDNPKDQARPTPSDDHYYDIHGRLRKKNKPAKERREYGLRQILIAEWELRHIRRFYDKRPLSVFQGPNSKRNGKMRCTMVVNGQKVIESCQRVRVSNKEWGSFLQSVAVAWASQLPRRANMKCRLRRANGGLVPNDTEILWSADFWAANQKADEWLVAGQEKFIEKCEKEEMLG